MLIHARQQLAFIYPRRDPLQVSGIAMNYILLYLRFLHIVHADELPIVRTFRSMIEPKKSTLTQLTLAFAIVTIARAAPLVLPRLLHGTANEDDDDDDHDHSKGGKDCDLSGFVVISYPILGFVALYFVLFAVLVGASWWRQKRDFQKAMEADSERDSSDDMSEKGKLRK